VTITTVTHTAGFNAPNDATFRAWGSLFRAAIEAAGWVQTADTGQVNWVTVTAPAANTNGVYEVYRLDDALQATDPVFLKVVYSRASNTNAGILRFQAGTASDGAGTITSAANTNTSVTALSDAQNGMNAGAPAYSLRSYVGGDGSSLMVLLAPNDSGSAGAGGGFLLERRRDPVTGEPAAGGFHCVWMPGTGQTTNSYAHHTVWTHNLYPQPAAGNGLILTGRGSSSAADNGVKDNVVPIFPYMTGGYPELGGPSKWIAGIFRADVPLGVTFPLSIYGEEGTFMSLGAGWATSSTVSFGAGFTRLTPIVRVA
jgi:hypothetical protein